MFQRTDMLIVADSVAQEKGIEREKVFQAMEMALEKAGRTKYGNDMDIRATIDRNTGAIKLYRCRAVVATETPDGTNEILLEQARRIDKDIEIGACLQEQLPPPDDLGRIATQNAKQVIFEIVRDAEREKQYEKFKDRVGTLASGVVKRIEYGNLVVDLEQAEAVLPREQLIPREHFKRGDRTLAYIYEVRRDNRRPQVLLSRTHTQLMVLLFRQEVPEVYDGVVQIMGCARDPGSRAKVGVSSKDSSIDPVGACVGMRGSRVQAVVGELQGEKVDIIPYDEDIATYVVNALAPAEVTKVVLDEEFNKIDVVVAEDQLSQAIGRRGQNVRLASQLTKIDIDLLTEEQDSERREKEFLKNRDFFINALDVDDVIARLLITEGFTSIEEVAEVMESELLTIDGFDSTLASELQSRAQTFVAKQERERQVRLKELGVDSQLVDFPGIGSARAVKLGEAGCLNLEDFAGLTPAELLEDEGAVFKEENVSGGQIAETILQARIALGWISQEEETAETDDETTQTGQDDDAQSPSTASR